MSIPGVGVGLLLLPLSSARTPCQPDKRLKREDGRVEDSDADVETEHRVPSAHGRHAGRLAIAVAVVTGMLLSGTLAWEIWHLRHLRRTPVGANVVLPLAATPSQISMLSTKRLSGFSAEILIRVNRAAKKSEHRPVFDFRSPEGARISLALNSTDSFLLTATDIRGKRYPLEIPLDEAGIADSIPVHLSCDIAATKEYLAIRVMVNGHRVAYRVFPERVDLGSAKWDDGSINYGGDGSEEAFLVRLVSEENGTLTDNERAYYRRLMYQNLQKDGEVAWASPFKPAGPPVNSH